MKAGVETRDLGHVWQPLSYSLNRSQVVRLMQGGERSQLLQLAKHGRSYQRWSGEAAASMHHTVTDRKYSGTAVHRPKPDRKRIECTSLVTDRSPELIIEQ